MDKLQEIFIKLGIEWTEEKAKQYEGYRKGILEWNESVNLTTITDEEEFELKHYVDSLTCADAEEFEEAETIVDIGTGGGFPGVPLAIAFPQKRFVLIDSLGKRIKIIDTLCADLGIHNVKAIHGRAEELARRVDLRERFDFCVSRAVANMSTLAEYCLPFVKVGGTFVAYKGPNSKEEIEAAQEAIEILGGEVYGVFTSELTEDENEHVLVFTEKIKTTPKKYPRKAGTPSKQPL